MNTNRRKREELGCPKGAKSISTTDTAANKFTKKKVHGPATVTKKRKRKK